MSRNAALRYDERIKSHISPPKRPPLHLLKAKGGDGAMSRDRGVAVLFPQEEVCRDRAADLREPWQRKKSLCEAKNCPQPECDESC